MNKIIKKRKCDDVLYDSDKKEEKWVFEECEYAVNDPLFNLLKNVNVENADNFVDN